MNYIVRKYYTGYCTYKIEVNNEDKALQIAELLLIDHEELLDTLDPWEYCDEIEQDEDT
jgi:hypothetical protein